MGPANWEGLYAMPQTLPRIAAPERDMDGAGREMARLIWDDDEARSRLPDPRDPIFARAVIDEFSTALRETAGVIRKVMRGASSAAEDLNVEPFQGLIEVIKTPMTLVLKKCDLHFERRAALSSC